MPCHPDRVRRHYRDIEWRLRGARNVKFDLGKGVIVGFNNGRPMTVTERYLKLCGLRRDFVPRALQQFVVD